MREKINSNIVPFCFGDNLVRVVDDEHGNLWFVAKDVAIALDYQWKGIATIGHVPSEWRGVYSVQTLSGLQEMLTLSEQGLYFFLGRSDKPKALPFQKWLAGDVLPSIRKTGRYEIPRTKKPSLAQNTRYALPAALLDVSLSLKPATRQRLWRDSLDTARLDGGGFDAACECFESLCGLMTAKRNFPDLASQIFRFMDECLESSPGSNTPGHMIYNLFVSWWQEYGHGAMPGRKCLSGYLQSRFQAFKSNIMFYRNCRIRQFSM